MLKELNMLKNVEAKLLLARKVIQKAKCDRANKIFEVEKFGLEAGYFLNLLIRKSLLIRNQHFICHMEIINSISHGCADH